MAKSRRPFTRRRAMALSGGTLLSSIAAPPLAEAGAAEDDLQGLPEVRFRQSGPGAVVRTIQEKAADIRDVRDYGIVADPHDEPVRPDQTRRLLEILDSLGADNFRGSLHIPYGVKFDVPTLYSRVPVGVTLYDDSSINWGQPPSYRSRLRIRYSRDEEADDSQDVVASSHHPALTLMNFGTTDSEAARRRMASLLHGVGQDHLGDPMVGWLMQFGRDSAADYWNWGLRLQTPYGVSIANPQPWTSGTRYSPGSFCIGHGSRVYRTAGGGISGARIPAGQEAVSDGGVRWEYMQEGLNADRTVLDLREDGRLRIYGPAEGRIELSSGNHRAYHAIRADGAIQWRHESRGLDIYTVTDDFGLRQGVAGSDHWLPVSGSAPVAPVTGAGKVRNRAPTTMSSLTAPNGRVAMTVTLRFDDSHTTLKHGTGFLLRGAGDVTPVAGSFVTLKLDASDTRAWREYHRSF